jgi:hypothetical protein
MHIALINAHILHAIVPDDARFHQYSSNICLFSHSILKIHAPDKSAKKPAPHFRGEPVLDREVQFFEGGSGNDALLRLFVKEVNTVGVNSKIDNFANAGTGRSRINTCRKRK